MATAILKKMDLYNELATLINQLQTSIKTLRKTGTDFAQADMEYKMALSTELLKLEAEGRPVSNLQYIARGKKEVAQKKYQQIATEAIYKANMEAIQAIKLQIKVLQARIDKEYAEPTV